MDMSLLVPVLVAGATIFGEKAVGKLGDGLGSSVFAAIKDRLTGAHGIKAAAHLDAGPSDADKAAITAELEQADLAGDAELAKLVAELIRALPSTAVPRAVEIDEIRAGGDLSFADVEGIRARTATSEGNMSFTGIKAPPGK